MLTSFTDQDPSDTYKGILHAGGQELPSTGQTTIYDGNGGASSLMVGTSGNGLTVTGQLSADSLVIGALTYPISSGNLNDILIQTDINGTIEVKNVKAVFDISNEENLTTTRTYNNVQSLTIKNGLVIDVVTSPRMLTLFLDLETFAPTALSAVGVQPNTYIYPYNQISSNTQNVRSIDPDIIKGFYLDKVWNGASTFYGSPGDDDIATVIVGYGVPNESTIASSLSSDIQPSTFKLYGILYKRINSNWEWLKYLSLDRLGNWDGYTSPQSFAKYSDAKVITWGDPSVTSTNRSVISLSANGGTPFEVLYSFSPAVYL